MALTLVLGSVNGAMAIEHQKTEWLEEIKFTYGKYSGFGFKFTNKSGTIQHAQNGFGIFVYDEVYDCTEMKDDDHFHGIYVGYAIPKPDDDRIWRNSREDFGVYVARPDSDENFLLQAGLFTDGMLHDQGVLVLRNEMRYIGKFESNELVDGEVKPSPYDYVYGMELERDGRQMIYYGEVRKDTRTPGGYGILNDPENKRWECGMFRDGYWVAGLACIEEEGEIWGYGSIVLPWERKGSEEQEDMRLMLGRLKGPI